MVSVYKLHNGPNVIVYCFNNMSPSDPTKVARCGPLEKNASQVLEVFSKENPQFFALKLSIAYWSGLEGSKMKSSSGNVLSNKQQKWLPEL